MPRPGSSASNSADAYVLASIGGFVDAVGVLTLGGLFVAHMSGNSAALGAAFGQGDWRTGAPHLFAVPVFLIGLFLGHLAILSSPTVRRCAWMLIAEAALLGAFFLALAWLGNPSKNTLVYFCLATPALLAMGFQNAALRQIGRSAFPSTYVTGVLDTLARCAAECVRKQGGSRDWRMVFAAAGIWASYLGGALAGSAGLLFIRQWILWLPILALLVLAARLFRATAPPPRAPGS